MTLAKIPGNVPADDHVASTCRQTVSHYRTVRKIGAGMGVVYEAEERKLGRSVVLNFIPEELASDPHGLSLVRSIARRSAERDSAQHSTGAKYNAIAPAYFTAIHQTQTRKTGFVIGQNTSTHSRKTAKNKVQTWLRHFDDNRLLEIPKLLASA